MPNWNRPQPAPLELKKLLKVAFPEIKLKVPDGKRGLKYNFDIYKVRNIAGTNKPSDHSEGRALDIYLDAFDENEKKIGDYLNKVFRDKAEEMGISYIIWNREIWNSYSKTPKKYAGDSPHTNHIHVSWTRPGSQKNILGSVVARLLLRAGFPGSEREDW